MTIEIPDDTYDLFSWKRPKDHPPEACAAEGIYCWCGRGLVYLGPLPGNPPLAESD